MVPAAVPPSKIACSRLAATSESPPSSAYFTTLFATRSAESLWSNPEGVNLDTLDEPGSSLDGRQRRGRSAKVCPSLPILVDQLQGFQLGRQLRDALISRLDLSLKFLHGICLHRADHILIRR